jgi:hypothetical protein
MLPRVGRAAYLGERATYLGERATYLGERATYLGERATYLGERATACQDPGARAVDMILQVIAQHCDDSQLVIHKQKTIRVESNEFIVVVAKCSFWRRIVFARCAR